LGEKEFNSVCGFLKSNKIDFKILTHAPVHTSEEAARIRGKPLSGGVKAIVLKSSDGKVLQALVSGDKRIDLKKLAKIIGTKRLSLASPIEVLEKTGCEIGSVHPLGNLSGLTVYMDKKVLENEIVDFSVGLHTHTIEMKCADLLKAINPKIEEYSL